MILSMSVAIGDTKQQYLILLCVCFVARKPCCIAGRWPRTAALGQPRPASRCRSPQPVVTVVGRPAPHRCSRAHRATGRRGRGWVYYSPSRPDAQQSKRGRWQDLLNT